MIRGDDAMAASPGRDQIPPMERPGRIAVNQQKRRAAAFVQIVIPTGLQAAGNARRTDKGAAKWLRSSCSLCGLTAHRGQQTTAEIAGAQTVHGQGEYTGLAMTGRRADQ